MKLKSLVKELNPLQRNVLKFCLEFLRDLSGYGSNNNAASSQVLSQTLQSIFRVQEYSATSLSNANIQSIVLVLTTMIDNIISLFQANNEVDKPRTLIEPTIECPPVIYI